MKERSTSMENLSHIRCPPHTRPPRRKRRRCARPPRQRYRPNVGMPPSQPVVDMNGVKAQAAVLASESVASAANISDKIVKCESYTIGGVEYRSCDDAQLKEFRDLVLRAEQANREMAEMLRESRQKTAEEVGERLSRLQSTHAELKKMEHVGTSTEAVGKADMWTSTDFIRSLSRVHQATETADLEEFNRRAAEELRKVATRVQDMREYVAKKITEPLYEVREEEGVKRQRGPSAEKIQNEGEILEVIVSIRSLNGGITINRLRDALYAHLESGNRDDGVELSTFTTLVRKGPKGMSPNEMDYLAAMIRMEHYLKKSKESAGKGDERRALDEVTLAAIHAIYGYSGIWNFDTDFTYEVTQQLFQIDADPRSVAARIMPYCMNLAIKFLQRTGGVKSIVTESNVCIMMAAHVYGDRDITAVKFRNRAYEQMQLPSRGRGSISPLAYVLNAIKVSREVLFTLMPLFALFYAEKDFPEYERGLGQTRGPLETLSQEDRRQLAKAVGDNVVVPLGKKIEKTREFNGFDLVRYINRVR